MNQWIHELPVVYIGLFNAMSLICILIFGTVAYVRLSARVDTNAEEARHLLALVKLHGQITDSQTVQTQGLMNQINPVFKTLEKQAEVIKKIVTSTNDIVVEDRPVKSTEVDPTKPI